MECITRNNDKDKLLDNYDPLGVPIGEKNYQIERKKAAPLDHAIMTERSWEREARANRNQEIDEFYAMLSTKSEAVLEKMKIID